MSDRWKEDGREDRRHTEDLESVGSRMIEPDQERELLEKGEFTRHQLYNRRGGLHDRGLAGLLETGDQILEVKPGLVSIRSREGTLQTFWDLTRPQVFIRPLSDEEKARLADEEAELTPLPGPREESAD